MDLATILGTILSPATPSEARKFAHEQIEIFKTRKDALDTCFGLFMKEMLGERREFMLHFCLRTCLDLIHFRYSTFSMEEASQVKAMTLAVLSNHLQEASPLVEGTGVNLAVEILKQDLEAPAFFDAIAQGLRNSSWCRVACDVISNFSEILVVEDEDSLVSSRRTKLTRYFVTVANSVLVSALDLIQQAGQQENSTLLISALKTCGECLRWAELLPGQTERFLTLIPACASTQFPVTITCAALKTLHSLCSIKQTDLDKSKIDVSRLYSIVRESALGRGSFRTDEELYDASDVILTMLMKHFPSLQSKSLAVQDLELLTTSNNPQVLADALEVWKHLMIIGQVELDERLVMTILRQCVTCPKSDGEEEEEEDYRGHTVKEIVRQQPDLACPVALSLIQACVENNRFKEAAFLVEAVSNGLSQHDFERFQQRTALSPAFVNVLESTLDFLFKTWENVVPLSADKLKLIHSAHRLFESKPNFLGVALHLFAKSALAVDDKARRSDDPRKRAATYLLQVLRRATAKKVDGVLLSSVVLPALIQQVSSSFSMMTGPERFILLECILVAGKALPNEEDQIQLTRQVLSEPFRILSSLGGEVMSNLLQERPSNGRRQQEMTAWDSRGYFMDIEFLPESSHQVALALMTLSTCSQDGHLTRDMWRELVPLAVECITRLDAVWETLAQAESPANWCLTIHPIDARCMLGGRLAGTMETFLDGLNSFGVQMLMNEKMAVIAFLSCIRSCGLELLKSALTQSIEMMSTLECERLFQTVMTMENRHLAALLNSVPVFDIHPLLFERLVVTINDRLRAPASQKPWRVRTYPGCSPELIEDVDDAARCSLELAFAKSLRSSCALGDASPLPDSKLVALSERLALGDETTIRHAALTIGERCLARCTSQMICRIVLRACLVSISKLASQADTDSRSVLDLGLEALSWIMFGCGVKDLSKAKTGLNSKVKKKPPTSEMNEVFGVSLVSKFFEEVTQVKSEKAFKSCGVDLIEGAVTAQRTTQVERPQTKKKTKAKKKKKSASAREEEDGIMDTVSIKNVPRWHEATSSRDLGTLLLFNGDDDDL